MFMKTSGPIINVNGWGGFRGKNSDSIQSYWDVDVGNAWASSKADPMYLAGRKGSLLARSN